jgi:hypothetical protein
MGLDRKLPGGQQVKRPLSTDIAILVSVVLVFAIGQWLWNHLVG